MATGFASKSAKRATNRTAPTEGPKPYLLTVKQFEAMIGAGVFAEGEHVELLGGELIQKMTKHDPHNFGVDEIAVALRAMLPAGWIAREEKSVVLDERWRPGPDIVVAKGPRSLYRHRSPNSKDIALIVEVSDSSYAEERGRKWVRYAAAKVPVYAILDIQSRLLEVHTKPWGTGEAARYRETATFGDAAAFPVVVEGVEVGRIAVRDVLA